MNATVYMLGILLQAVAVVIALMQVRRSLCKLPWLLIGLSSLFIVFRRAETLEQSIKLGRELAMAEVFTLLSALLFFMGVILMSRMFNDIRKNQLALQKSQEDLHAVSLYARNLIEASLDPLVTINGEGKITDANSASENATGINREKLIGSDFADYFTDPGRARKGYGAVFKNGIVKDFPLAIKNQNGKIMDVLYNASLYKNEDGTIAGIFAAARDITERKIAEDQTKHLLAEKEIILKEVHHRIKNNMNTINGLLVLQAEFVKEPAAVEALNDAGNRLKSMMVLYNKLYLSPDFKEISLKEYLTTLVTEIITMFQSKNNIKTEMHIEDCIVPVQTVFPVGIIINELITNIMKYAFQGRNEGVIRFSVKVNNKHITLALQDDGIGLPDTVDLNANSGFGMQLVSMLTEQIEGKISIERENGTKFILEFDAA